MKKTTKIALSLLLYCLVRLPIWISVPYLWWHLVLDVVSIYMIIAVGMVTE